MPRSALVPPNLDPTPLFEHFRGSYATELLTVAVTHLRVPELLAAGPLTWESLRTQLGLQERPLHVLLTALRALGLVEEISSNTFGLTALAREHLVPTAEFAVTGYLGLAGEAPGVLHMLERLRTNRPAGTKAEEAGTAFIFKEGEKSQMEKEASARQLTLALAGRAKNVAPLCARHFPLPEAGRLLDVGGGTGIYSIAWLQQHPHLHATIWDRPEVLRVAEEFARSHGTHDRMTFLAGDMFRDPVPPGHDVHLLSNVLHDWDVPECQQLLRRSSDALVDGGQVLIHDVFLADDLAGPLPIALYSAALFTLTEGRAYSAAEYRRWLNEAGLKPGKIVPTLIHCGLLPGKK